jgi:hypothetical protein
MPDFFDRLIARGTQQPGGGMPSPGQPARPVGRASDPGSGAPVAFARPRLPGPFERLAAEPPDPFLEAVDEVREVDAARPGTPRARPAFGSLAGTQPAITAPPLLRDAATPLAPGRALRVPGEQPPARPGPPQQAPLLPRATPVHLVADAGAGAPDQASARASRPAADRDQERDARPSTASRRPEHLSPQPSPPRTLAVPASAVRAARPAADAAGSAQAQPPAPPPVVVRIGRIEVRNTSPDRRERQAKRRGGRAAPRQTLAAYLAAAYGGGVSTGGAR